MSSLLIPVPVVVVGHHGDPVQVPSQAGHLVADINDLLAGRHRGGQQQAQRTEGRPQLPDQAGEPGLVLVPLPLTLSLNKT